MLMNGSVNICVSGGAIGADQQWGMTAGYLGHTVFHFSFAEHRANVPKIELVVLSEAMLREADPYVQKANQALKRKFPTKNDFVNNLLRRNWYQVRDTQAVYAVASLKKSGEVSGGTAWAVQMFIDRFDGGACPVYLFDQISEKWHTWNGTEWIVIDVVPRPEGVWTGIGSRELLPSGKAAIRTLMGWNGGPTLSR